MGSNPTLSRYFSTQVYFNGDEEVGPRSLKGYVDPYVSSVGRASDLRAVGGGVESYAG